MSPCGAALVSNVAGRRPAQARAAPVRHEPHPTPVSVDASAQASEACGKCVEAAANAERVARHAAEALVRSVICLRVRAFASAVL